MNSTGMYKQQLFSFLIIFLLFSQFMTPGSAVSLEVQNLLHSIPQESSPETGAGQYNVPASPLSDGEFHMTGMAHHLLMHTPVHDGRT